MITVVSSPDGSVYVLPDDDGPGVECSGNTWRRLPSGFALPPGERHSYEWTDTLPIDLASALRWARDGDGHHRRAPREYARTILDNHGASIVYLGAPADLDRLHRIVTDATAEAIRVWNWRPTGMYVAFHRGGKAVGLAWSAGRFSRTGRRMLSLRRDYVEDWPDDAIYDTVLHELCHHYREEKWPRAELRTRSSVAARKYWHDEVFCSELHAVLPAVDTYDKCWAETAPPIAERAAVRSEKRRQRSERAKVAAETVWSPGRGEFVWDTDASTLTWRPRRGKGIFRRYSAEIEDELIMRLLGQFKPTDWHRIPVHQVGNPVYGVDDFAELLDHLIAEKKVGHDVEGHIVLGQRELE